MRVSNIRNEERPDQVTERLDDLQVTAGAPHRPFRTDRVERAARRRTPSASKLFTCFNALTAALTLGMPGAARAEIVNCPTGYWRQNYEPRIASLWMNRGRHYGNKGACRGFNEPTERAFGQNDIYRQMTEAAKSNLPAGSFAHVNNVLLDTCNLGPRNYWVQYTGDVTFCVPNAPEEPAPSNSNTD